MHKKLFLIIGLLFSLPSMKAANHEACQKTKNKTSQFIKASLMLAAPHIIMNGIKPGFIAICLDKIVKNIGLNLSTTNYHRLGSVNYAVFYGLLAAYFWPKALKLLQTNECHAFEQKTEYA